MRAGDFRAIAGGQPRCWRAASGVSRCPGHQTVGADQLGGEAARTTAVRHQVRLRLLTLQSPQLTSSQIGVTTSETPACGASETMMVRSVPALPMGQSFKRSVTVSPTPKCSDATPAVIGWLEKFSTVAWMC